MTVTAHHIAPGQGLRYDMIDGAHVVKAGADETGGAFELFEVEAPRAPAAPLHRSPWTATMYVLDGTLGVHFEDADLELTAGSTLTIPGQTAYTFEVLGESARFLAATGGDRAGAFFADFAASVPVDRPLEESLPSIVAVTERHGVTMAG